MEGVAPSTMHSEISNTCFENVDLSQCDCYMREKFEHEGRSGFCLCMTLSMRNDRWMPKTASCWIELCRNIWNAHMNVPQNLPVPWFPTCIISQAHPLVELQFPTEFQTSFLPPLHKNSEAAAFLTSTSASKLHIFFKEKQHITRVCIHFLTISYMQNCATPFTSFLFFYVTDKVSEFFPDPIFSINLVGFLAWLLRDSYVHLEQNWWDVWFIH